MSLMVGSFSVAFFLGAITHVLKHCCKACKSIKLVSYQQGYLDEKDNVDFYAFCSYLATSGMCLPLPKAFDVTLRMGGA